MSAKHTPGPWEWNDATDIYDPRTGATICEFYRTPREGTVQMANARLIAAAPDMLEVLKQALIPLVDAGFRDAGYIVPLLRKVIAKAEGKP